ncbi:hypothetical protein C9374_004234 [Naegleria lovaniensis]|uniref:Uncharacterized protein n=1 Tax=Naegleria lovaniensis TaxID=51637 RepID=A0AA88GSX6_NAELO|nr:uncharacterized protein C9374_004234 [Naegleria lovaniensis]KAG2383563.1 hypothetical protein C9374_004234 [Naegleria lovaniensis]
MSQYACHDSYVVFWTPFASHLSFKIIELFLFFIQFVIGVLVVLIPLTQRNLLKWRNYFKYVNDRKLIENSQLERIKKMENASTAFSSVTSSPNLDALPSSPNMSNTNSPTMNGTPTSSEPMTTTCTPNAETPFKAQPIPSTPPKPETIFEIGLRVACDLNLLCAVNMVLSMLSNVLVSLTFITITYYKGNAVYAEESFNLEMVSVELMVLANVPLALTFLSVLMKLDKTKRRVSLYAIVTVFILCLLLMLLTLVLFFVSFALPGDTQKVTRLIALPFVLVALVVCWTVILIDTIRTYRVLKKNNVNVSFFQFKFSRYIFLPIILSLYLAYDIPAEAGLISAAFSFDIFWAFLWKHRVEVYLICILNWGLVYVLFNKNRFLYCYQKPLSLCMSKEAIKKINKTQKREQHML